MPQVGFEPAIPTSARPQTYALDPAATGIGILSKNKETNIVSVLNFYDVVKDAINTDFYSCIRDVLFSYTL
jgi:hypothetical protein